jgi:hypothetical protein
MNVVHKIPSGNLCTSLSLLQLAYEIMASSKQAFVIGQSICLKCETACFQSVFHTELLKTLSSGLGIDTIGHTQRGRWTDGWADMTSTHGMPFAL